MHNGVIIVNKPRGLTSNDVVMRLKRKFKMREIGHTGTLDPDVDGVLVVCLGKMTKLVPFLMADEKVYVGVMTLGYTTDTEDASGTLLEKSDITNNQFSHEVIDDMFKQMIGKLVQRPPMYSAVKVNGRPLYEYARRGETIEVPTREIKIFDFHREGEVTYHDEVLDIPFYARVSHGTYIRTLCVQFGEKLGIHSHMKELKRVQNGSMDVDMAVDLQTILDSEMPEQYIKSGLSVLNRQKWKECQIDQFNETVYQKIMNGAKLTLQTPHLFDYTVITDGNRIISFYEKCDDAYRCVRGIFEGAENGSHSN